MSLWDAYQRTYGKQFGTQMQREALDQELVGFLAESWAAGRSYGARINSLLERIVRFLEAIRNALRGMGFQTADDVFERVASGEVARRTEGGRREPTLGVPPAPMRPESRGRAVRTDSVNGLAAQIRKALEGRQDEDAQDIEFAVSLWQAGSGDPSIGASLSEALADAGHTALAARIGALLDRREHQ